MNLYVGIGRLLSHLNSHNLVLDRTMQFNYNNGLGSSVSRFMIDLYEAEGSGDCGSWQTSICDKPDVGCKDTGESRGTVESLCAYALRVLGVSYCTS